jgi:hypothetical protein
MIRRIILAGALAAATSAAVAAPAADSREVRIPRMSRFLDWHADGHRGIYIRADTGRWYYARTQGECARLRPTAAISFSARGNELDRYGAIRVDGWRCQLASVTESNAPASHKEHH